MPRVTSEFCGVIFETENLIDIFSIFTVPKPGLQLSSMVEGIMTRGNRSKIKDEQTFSRRKAFFSYDFGIIKSGKTLMEFFRRFCLSWTNALGGIPHLNPLPLKKGEANFPLWKETGFSRLVGPRHENQSGQQNPPFRLVKKAFRGCLPKTGEPIRTANSPLPSWGRGLR